MSRQSEKNWRLIGAVFLSSILITLLFWNIVPASLQANESSDYIYFYEPVAQNLLAGHGLTTANGEFATAYPPGYPLLLAIVKSPSWLLFLERFACFGAW